MVRFELTGVVLRQKISPIDVWLIVVLKSFENWKYTCISRPQVMKKVWPEEQAARISLIGFGRHMIRSRLLETKRRKIT